MSWFDCVTRWPWFASADSITAAELVSCASMTLRLDGNVRDPIPYYMLMLDRVRELAEEFDIFYISISTSSISRCFAADRRWQLFTVGKTFPTSNRSTVWTAGSYGEASCQPVHSVEPMPPPRAFEAETPRPLKRFQPTMTLEPLVWTNAQFESL
jgi:hypothetical protein